MRAHGAVHVAALALVAAASLASCGGRGRDAAVGEAPPTGSIAAPDTSSTSTTVPEIALTGEEKKRRHAEVEQEQENEVGACMARAGFPYDTSYDARSNAESEAHRGSLTPESFRESYGFGVSTRLDLARELFAPRVVEPDPNLGYADSLSIEGRKKYIETMVGCKQAHDPLPQPTDEEQRVYDGRAEIARRIQADTRIVAAARDWSHCMSSAGFPYGTPADLQADLEARAAPYVEQYERAMQRRPRNPPAVADVLDPAEMAELQAVQAFEMAAARADGPCSAPYEDVYAVVYKEHVERFLAGG